MRAHELTARRYDLLVMVIAAGEAGATISSLAERLALAANSVTELVDRAHDAGLVVRAAHPSDGRATLVFATATGRERVAGAVAELQPQRRQLLNLLAEVRERLEAAETPSEPRGEPQPS